MCKKAFHTVFALQLVELMRLNLFEWRPDFDINLQLKILTNFTYCNSSWNSGHKLQEQITTGNGKQK